MLNLTLVSISASCYIQSFKIFWKVCLLLRNYSVMLLYISLTKKLTCTVTHITRCITAYLANTLKLHVSTVADCVS